MRKIFILTDLMFSGQHLYFENFIKSAELHHIEFTFEPNYWNLHTYDWDSYDQLYCIIDHRDGFENNPEFVSQFKNRMDLLRQNGFKFVLARPWESEENVAGSKFYDLLRGYNYTKWFGSTSWFWYLMREKYKGYSFDCDHSHKPYEYLYLNKQPRAHRQLLWQLLTEKNLIDKSLKSFIGLKQPVRLDPAYELPDVDPKNYPIYGRDQDIYMRPYEHTACSLISETNDNEVIFITEKLWKPIICQHFFIVHGNYLYLQKIREMGFMTFGQYFDESYDLEPDPYKRAHKILALIEKLKNFDWKDAYLSSKKLRAHNLNTFWDDRAYQTQVRRTVNEFLGLE